MDFSGELNDRQLEAVRCTEGPLLIIAGAGSGKTRVLTYRIAHLIQDCGADPWNIMAITFTNKAADEMRQRVNDIAGFGAEAVWVSTFHSACARILRRYIDRIGYTSAFSIYDTDDSKRVIKDIAAELNLDPKKFPPKRFQGAISHAKNHNVSVSDMERDAGDLFEETTAKVYRVYEETLFKSNALDFDDLLIKTVELFKKDSDVLESYQERLKYIMVDEYQDTNAIQFELVRLLAGKYRNLCVVGDDDQSIYKFRGADIRNILDFERVFPEARVVKLEQNYRSAGNILKGANAVIRNNTEHKDKTLWTDKEDGAPITYITYQSGFEEAEGVIDDIQKLSCSESLNAFAVLYRTNAQSRLFEEQLVRRGIPYRLVGGVNFYARKEIKDILAYLKTIENALDALAIRRIINIPRRGIGDKSIERVAEYAGSAGIGFFEALGRAGEIPGLGRTAQKIEDFVLFIKKYRAFSGELNVDDLIKRLVDETGYVRGLLDEGTDEAAERIENINELISKATAYMESADEPSLSGFLQEVALVADIDTFDENADRVVLMTLHGAKGLEFDNVYIVGLEDGLFPSFHSVFDADETQLEEERRLFYVGMTRARKTLKLTNARQRFVRGEQERHEPSRFIAEIPPELIKKEGYGNRAGGVNRPEAGRPVYDGDVFAASGRGGYGRPKRAMAPEVPYGKVFDASEFKVKKASSLDYGVGDTVRHTKFGIGKVLDIKDGAADFEVRVEFEKFGVKRMFAAFAKLERV